jgi:phosphoribosylanthranilate isomerase
MKKAKEVRVRTRIKICCIASEAEMQMAVECGVDAVGLVSAMPSGPGVIAEEQIAQIVARIPPPVASFLLTSRQDADAIIAQQKHTRANTLQLVDSVPTAEYARLRDALPGIAIVQVIHVVGPSSVEEAVHIAPYVNALLLDSGNPSLAMKELV